MSGSLRRGSYNSALLRATAELLPEGMTLDIVTLDDIPLYNEDLLSEAGFPESVQRLRAQIAAADALLIVTPEYNHSIPGVLKNAIDWASRPPEMPFAGKPAAIMGAATGMMGTVRAQQHLRQILTMLNVHVLNKPEVLVAQSREKFDADGQLVDANTRKFVALLLQNLGDWTHVIQRQEAAPTALVR
jgi:chromate reductase, NAD(P)H dehydrogenase (quinone)